MGSGKESRNRLVRAVITAIIMPVTICAGWALGYLACLVIGSTFFDNPEVLMNWGMQNGARGIIGMIIVGGGAILGAALPWIVFFFFNPDKKRHRGSGGASGIFQI